MLVAAVTMPASAKSKGPLFADPSLDASLIDKITLYGANHSHALINDEGLAGSLDGVIHGLGKRGYKDSAIKIGNPRITPTDAMLNNPTNGWLAAISDTNTDVFTGGGKTLGEHKEPPRWIAILAVDEMPGKPEGTFRLGTIALSLYVYDRSRALLLWHDHVEKSVNGGLVGNHILKAKIKYEQSLELASEMAMKFPKREKH